MFALRIQILALFSCSPQHKKWQFQYIATPVSNFSGKIWNKTKRIVALCTLLSFYPAHAENSNILAPCFNYAIFLLFFCFFSLLVVFTYLVIHRFSLPSPIFYAFSPFNASFNSTSLIFPLSYFSESVLSLPPFCCLSFFFSFFLFGQFPFLHFPLATLFPSLFMKSL